MYEHNDYDRNSLYTTLDHEYNFCHFYGQLDQQLATKQTRLKVNKLNELIS